METVLHVLVVDDSPAQRELLATYIKALRTDVREAESVRIEVEQAENGDAALDALDRGGVDLMFLDLDMPKMGGLDVLELKKDDARINRIPVIVCAEPQDELRVAAAHDLGAAGHIYKPFDWTSVTDAWRFL